MSTAYNWIQEQICLLSENPPLSCGLGSRETGNTRRIRVDVTYQSLARIISWTLSDSEGTTIGLSNAGDVTESSLFSFYFDLPVGEYRFDATNLNSVGKNRR